jgi:hypothetical protein
VLKEVLAIERQIGEGVARGNPDVVEKTLADEFVYSYAGSTMDKWQFLSKITPLPDYISSSIHDTNLRLDGSTATLTGTGIISFRSYKFITQFSDTFIKRNGRWQIISAKILKNERSN